MYNVRGLRVVSGTTNCSLHDRYGYLSLYQCVACTDPPPLKEEEEEEDDDAVVSVIELYIS